MKTTPQVTGLKVPKQEPPPPVDFEALFDHHARAVYRLCARRTGDLDLAHDLTSITFLEAWRRRDTMPADADVMPWLMGVAINVSRNATRSRRRYAAALARLPPPPIEPDHAERVADQSTAQEQLGRAVTALASLNATDRDVITLICWQELSYEQTAAALGLPVGTVRSRLSRARQRLATIVTDEEM